MINSVYLNNAAQGWPFAPGVIEVVNSSLNLHPFEAGRSNSGIDHVTQEARQLTCKLLDTTNPSEIFLFNNASTALNQAIFGLEFLPGDEVITSVVEHNSVLRPLRHLEKTKGIVVRYIDLDDEGTLDFDEYEKLISRKTKLVVLTHASNVTGSINQVKPFFQLAKQNGALTLLDASQSIGVTDVHPIELHADMVAFPGHKGLHSISGTGILFCSINVPIKPILFGGTGNYSELLEQPEHFPFGFETGTKNTQSIYAYSEAVRWNLNQTDIHEKTRKTGLELKKIISSVKGVNLIGNSNTAGETGAVSFTFEGWMPDDVGLIFEQSYNIVCRTGLHCAPLIHNKYATGNSGSIRLSASIFNHKNDLFHAGESLEAIRQCG